MKPPSLSFRLRMYFIAGLLVVVPGAVSIWIVVKLFHAFTDVVPWIAERLQYGDVAREHPIIARAIGLLVVVLVVLLIGMLARNVIGKRIIATGEWIVLKVPIFGMVYSTVRQIVNAFGADRRGMFQKVVLFEYPKKDCWVIGFQTKEAFDEASEKAGTHLIGVFVPTTPNPTSGFLLYVPESELTYLDMTIGDAMRLIVSGGAVHPPARKSASTPSPSSETPS